MRRGQKIKVVAATGSDLDRNRKIIRRIATKWTTRLQENYAPDYDLTQKLIVIKEVLPEDDRYEYPRKGRTQARVQTYLDYQGRVLEADHESRVQRGDYLLVVIEFLTKNWPSFSTEVLEQNLVHELLHVLDPKMGLFVKDGHLMEDEDLMNRKTRELIERMRDNRRVKFYHYARKGQVKSILKEGLLPSDSEKGYVFLWDSYPAALEGVGILRQSEPIKAAILEVRIPRAWAEIDDNYGNYEAEYRHSFKVRKRIPPEMITMVESLIIESSEV
jgi:hypothetical protein